MVTADLWYKKQQQILSLRKDKVKYFSSTYPARYEIYDGCVKAFYIILDFILIIKILNFNTLVK